MDPAHAPDFFEQALKDGKVDFLMINRAASYADYEYVSKLAEGRVDEIRPCCRCLHCVGDFGNHTGVNESCRMNPAHGRAYSEEMPEGFKVPAGDGQKKVVVVGGGPAGMEAARVCAERGYTVTLFEKSSSLGGLLDFAHTVKGPHENLDRARAYLSRMLDATGVNVVTGQEADAAAVKAENPDVVLWLPAVCVPNWRLREASQPPVVGIADALFLDGKDQVLIVGFNAQALDMAWYLLAQGKTVNMVAADDEANLGKGQSDKMKMFTVPALYARGVRVFPNVSVKSVGEGSVVVCSEAGVDVELPCDCVVNAADMVVNLELRDALAGEGVDLYAVGDCADPWDIQSAITAANIAARHC